jgi:proline dehydrogenase
MTLFRRVLLAATDNTFLERQAMTRAVSRRIALRFIAGETLEHGIAAVRQSAAEGKTATLDFLGEAVRSPDDARAAQRTIVEGVNRITEESLPCGVSVKPTQMGIAFDPDLAYELLGGVAAAAAASGAHVTLDMEGSDVTEATVALCERLRADGHTNVGCALQAYLRRTRSDVERLTAAGASLRLTKGAYDEPPDIAFKDRREVDATFGSCADWLLRNGHYPRIATHDEALIERAKRTVIRHGLSPTDFEFQMLYGVRRELQDRLVAAGWRLRVYIPFGTQWYQYFMRRLAERPANLLFFLRALAGS